MGIEAVQASSTNTSVLSRSPGQRRLPSPGTPQAPCHPNIDLGQTDASARLLSDPVAKDTALRLGYSLFTKT
jgi:hypothetical protein